MLLSEFLTAPAENTEYPVKEKSVVFLGCVKMLLSKILTAKKIMNWEKKLSAEEDQNEIGPTSASFYPLSKFFDISGYFCRGTPA